MDKLLLDKYINGECTPEEAAQVEAWMQGVWEQEVAEPMPVKMEMELREAFPVVPRRQFHWWFAAAAAIIICIAGYWLLQSPPATPVNTTITISEARYTLPDKSVVYLNNARIQVDTAAYGIATRTVTLLSGEAFFEVQKDKTHPFIVQHHDVQTRVLGTSFSIRTGDTVQVTVATGKVEVSHRQKVLNVLLPGKQISVQPTGQFTEQEVPVWMASLRTKSTLQLTNAPFKELALAMKTIYGITLQTNNKTVQQKNYNIRLDKAMPAEQVIQVLALLNQNHYRKLTPATYLLY